MSVEGPEAHILAEQMNEQLLGRRMESCEVRYVERLQRSEFVNRDFPIPRGWWETQPARWARCRPRSAGEDSRRESRRATVRWWAGAGPDPRQGGDGPSGRPETSPCAGASNPQTDSRTTRRNL